MNIFYVFATRNAVLKWDAAFFSPPFIYIVGQQWQMLLERQLPALDPTSGSSSCVTPDKLPNRDGHPAIPVGLSTHLHVSHGLLGSFGTPSCRAFRIRWPRERGSDTQTPWRPTDVSHLGMKSATSPPPPLHYWGRQGSVRSASTILFVPLCSPSSTSRRHVCPLWNGNPAPLKNVNLEQITAALMLM